MAEKIDLPYFYMMPKVHKTPWKTRPVISGINLVMEPLSKFLDVQLQRIVYLCPGYLKDSWQFLNDIRGIEIKANHPLVTADATAMYTNINTEHSIDVFRAWFVLHSNELPKDFPQRLVLDGL